MRRFLVLISLVVPILACGPMSRQVTPTPTKTPTSKATEQLLLATATPPVLPVHVTTPTAVPATPTPPPPTNTPPPPTDTPVPQPSPTHPPAAQPPKAAPRPTHTPAPPPPTAAPATPLATNTPVPPPTPANRGPVVTVNLPNGNEYRLHDKVTVIITVSDPDGVSSFTWGIFSQNRTSLAGDTKECGRATSCEIEAKFEAKLAGQFAVGVEAVDTQGQKTQTNAAQIYVG